MPFRENRIGGLKPVQDAKCQLSTAFFHGASMKGAFRDGDRLFIESCEVADIREGDVVVFIAPGGDHRIVHRVLAVGADRFRARGDANPGADPWLLDKENLIGRVTAYERNGRLHPVAGGRRGRLHALVTRTIRRVDHHSSSFLHPIYRSLSRSSILRRLVPGSLRPRVIVLRKEGDTEMQLLMGRRVIGRRTAGGSGWTIRRPFRIFVDEEGLP